MTENCPCGLTSFEVEVLDCIHKDKPFDITIASTLALVSLREMELISKAGRLTERGQIVLNSKLCGDL